MNVVWSLWRVGTAKRADMRAVPKAAAAKGFVVGCFQFERNDGSTVHGDSAKEVWLYHRPGTECYVDASCLADRASRCRTLWQSTA